MNARMLKKRGNLAIAPIVKALAKEDEIRGSMFARWRTFLLALVLVAAGTDAAYAQYCPQGQNPTTDPPKQNLAVTIISIRPNSDMEGDDDYVPFYDNHADIYGTVTIDGQDFSLPEIEDSDFPHWQETAGRFVKRVEGGIVPIKIAIRENDAGLTGANDWVDVSPAANKDTLELFFDTCALRVTGDVTGSAQGVIEARAGNDADDATIRLRVEMEDGRAITANDVALVNFDLIQVVPQVSRMVAAKPIVGLVRVANNTPVTLPVSVRVIVTGQNNTLIRDQTESLGDPLQPGEVRKKYLFEPPNALVMPELPRPYTMQAVARIIHGFDESTPSPQDPSPRCRTINNSTGALTWTVVPNQRPDILWIRVSALLDATDFVSMDRVHAIRELAVPFINGTFPVASTSHDTSSIPLVLPAAAAQDFLYSILQATGIPADSLLPFAMVLELNGVAALTGHDRIMGVVRHNWFSRFRYDLWGDKSGVSLAEFAPRAVIFQATKNGEGGSVGPPMSLPVHELGHTYGLSVEPSIKNTWACHIGGQIGVLFCGAAGGFDEYTSDRPYDGNPSGGYWVRQGPIPPALNFVLGEQCTFCFMGKAPANIHLNWQVEGRWIDNPDYERLLDRLALGASAQAFIIQPQQYVFVSGILAHDDRAFLGATYRLPQRPRVVDFARNDKTDLYALRFVGAGGRVLSQVTFRGTWNIAEFKGRMPAAFFAGTAPMPASTRAIEIWNQKTRKRVAQRVVSANPPTIGQPSWSVAADPPSRGRVLTIAWQAADADGDKLSHFAHVRPAGGNSWRPIAHEAKEPSLRVPLADIPAGTYELRVLSSDGVNLAERTTRLVIPRGGILPPVAPPIRDRLPVR